MITPSEIQQHQSNRFDAQFAAACKAGQIAWYPWVGAQYLSAACKVLVILESHYINWERNNIDALSLQQIFYNELYLGFLLLGQFF